MSNFLMIIPDGYQEFTNADQIFTAFGDPVAAADYLRTRDWGFFDTVLEASNLKPEGYTVVDAQLLDNNLWVKFLLVPQ